MDKNLPYIKALNEVIKVRNQRALIYGNDWQKDPDWAILAEIRQKYKRLKMVVIENKLNDYEHKKDCLIDLCNYALFMLQNTIDEEEKK